MVDGGFFLCGKGKGGHDPRSENDKRQQKFQQTVAVVSRAYAN